VDDTFGTNISGERPYQSDGTPGNPPGTMVSRGVDETLGTNISGANPSHESVATGPSTYRTGTTGRSDMTDNPVTRAADDTFGINMSGERPDQADGTPASPPGTMVSRGVDKTLGTNVSGANPGHESLASGPSTRRTETVRGDVTDSPVTRAADDALGTNMSGERPDQADGTPANPKGTMVSRGVDRTLGTNVSGANPGHKVG